MRISALIILLMGLMVIFSCRREDEIFDEPSAQLQFSTDSVMFDTVFTTVGTITKNIRVYNPYKERIRISSIRLRGGESSNFRINVDGSPGPLHTNVEIAAEDSMFIFIEATIDPMDQDTLFVINDYIEFITNGNQQEVILEAWGEDAYYFTPTSFNQNLPDFTCLTSACSDAKAPVDTTWTKDRPIVIYGFVAIDSLDRLTIEAGTKIYFHQGGGMWVYRGGSLRIMGTEAEPVIFQGDRREPAFENRPGQWDRIWINEGGQNEINHARIRNGFIGIQAEVLPFDDPPYDPSSLVVRNTTIENCSGFGLLSSIFNLRAENLVVSNSGQYNMVLRSAGNYDFYHCTFANYFSDAARETPSVLIQNSFLTANNTQVIGEPQVGVYNSIIYGNLDNEFSTEIINNGSISLDFRNVILQTTQSTGDTTQFKNIIRNPADQIFKDPANRDFSLSENSLARDQGDLNIATNNVPLDIRGNSRTTDGSPDLGAYEFTP